MARLVPGRGKRASDPDVLKRRLVVTQTGSEIDIVVTLSPDAVAERLHVRSPSGQWVPVATFESVAQQSDSNVFAARLSWEDPQFTSAIGAVLSTGGGTSPPATATQPLDLFVEIVAPARRFSEAPRPGDVRPVLDDREQDGTPTARAWLTLSRFTQTELSGRERYSTAGNDYLIYPASRGNLTIAVDVMPRPVVRVDIEKALLEGDELVFEGTLYTHHTEPTDLQFVLEGRDSEVAIKVPLQAREDLTHPADHGGHRSYAVSATVRLTEFLDRGASDDIFTAWVFVTADDAAEIHRARVGISRYRTRRRANEAWVERDGRAVLVSAYYTFVATKLSLTVEHFDAAQLHQMLTGIKRLRSRRPRQQRQKPVWLIGEQKYKAQDTGLAFFRYMREHHREVDAYYVIAEDALDKSNLEGLDHVVDFRSREHLDLFFCAERIITSHHPEYIYPSKSRMLKNAAHPVRVFLQHGVFGVRRLDKLYGRRAPGFHTDLFIVSSKREKRNAITDLGYRPEEVAVTGLSRFDTLFDGKTAVKPRQILIMPTWREWLQTEHSFLNSVYYARWKELLTSPRFIQLLDEHDAEAVLLLHPNMRMYASHFQSSRVRLLSQGQQPVQELLKESGILVTDYSSVGFDFSFLQKPVLFYQFDSDKFMNEGSHIDLDSELPGPISWTRDGLLDALEFTLARGGTIEPEYARRAASLLAHDDTRNGERIFAAVTAAGRRRESWADKNSEALRSAERVFRQRRAYLAVMTRLFAAWKRLPVKDDLIVFDAASTSLDGGSARAIYEELVRRQDTRTKIWIHDGKIKVSDGHTRVVTRLSPAYYWYLARARYWISDHYFPDHITRRRTGVFLQTRHGTPVVRQLHDQRPGRASDKKLLDLHTAAVGQWSHLLSPSPFATEVFASAFQHQAEVLELGYPRLDALSTEDAQAQGSRIRQKLGLGAQQTVVLYAPTYRADQPAGEGRFAFEPPFTITEMADALGPDHVLLIRLHPLMVNDLRVPDGYQDRIINVSSYPSLNDLYLASDALITDYSSILFDYAILQRPIVFLPYDLDVYRDKGRGFYLDYEHELPGPVVTELKDLRDALDQSTADLDSRPQFLHRFAPHADGHAASRVVDRLFGAV